MAIFDDDLFEYLEPRDSARFPFSGVCAGSANPIALIMRPAGRPNQQYVAAMRKLRERSDLDDMDIAHIEVFAKHVIIGWENVFKDGKPVPYSAQAGEELLTKLIRRKRADLVHLVIRFATDMDNFRGPMPTAEDVGNG